MKRAAVHPLEVIVLAIAIAFVACGLIVEAATTYTPAPAPSAHDVLSPPIRYSTPYEGFLVVDVVTSGVGDQTIALDAELAGYLERVVYSHNGNDASWSITITDHEGVALYTDAAANAEAGPVSRVVVCDDADGNGFGGPPFAGGLSIAIANADDGTGTAVSLRLYIREAWRR